MDWNDFISQSQAWFNFKCFNFFFRNRNYMQIYAIHLNFGWILSTGFMIPLHQQNEWDSSVYSNSLCFSAKWNSIYHMSNEMRKIIKFDFYQFTFLSIEQRKKRLKFYRKIHNVYDLASLSFRYSQVFPKLIIWKSSKHRYINIAVVLQTILFHPGGEWFTFYVPFFVFFFFFMDGCCWRHSAAKHNIDSTAKIRSVGNLCTTQHIVSTSKTKRC